MLVQDLHQYVAISEEFANNAVGAVKSGGLLFDRRVTRTITPGTLIDERFIDPYENNFLLAIYPVHENSSSSPTNAYKLPPEMEDTSIASERDCTTVGLAWSDLSTGDFFTQTTSLNMLPSALAKINAKEIVLHGKSEDESHLALLRLLEGYRQSIAYHPAILAGASASSWSSMLEAPVDLATQSTFEQGEVLAGSLLLSYVRDRLQGSNVKFQPPIRRQDKQTMSIDKNSMRALEILSTSKEGLGGGKGSLFHTIRKTVTKSGSRLLRDWISSPSMSLDTINERLDLVEAFRADHAFKEEIVRLLRRSYDSQRLVQKFSMGRGDADDLISLLRTIEVTKSIVELLATHKDSTAVNGGTNSKGLSGQQQSLDDLSKRISLDGPNALAIIISNSIDEDGLMESHRAQEADNSGLVGMAQEILHTEGTAEDQLALQRVIRTKAKSKPPSEAEVEESNAWILRKNASEILEKLHASLAGLKDDKANLTFRLREELAAPSLTLRWTPGLGFICHVKGNRDVSASLKNSTTSREAKTTKSTRSFHHPEWISLGNMIDQAQTRIRGEEQRVLQQLREQVVMNLVKLRRNASVLDELDVACSFAALAEEHGFTRPILNNSFSNKIIGGRHPTVKQGLEEQGRNFVSNNCDIGEKERIWLITGPNMAGKSTFLRQNALISILAQVGSFVPADYAEIGLVDQVFTRVGSADNLFKDQSTFMVEMMETATILNEATPQSFVIMDEIGRGTTPEDGVAVGFACLHHLYHRNRCRTLFATHFHSLADMTQDWKHLGCYCTDVVEGPEDSFSFVHRLRSGVNRSSHALKVARLAGRILVAVCTPLY